MRFSVVFFFILFAQSVTAQSVADSLALEQRLEAIESRPMQPLQLPIGDIISLVANMMSREPYKPILAVKANRLKGRLFKRYNKWYNRGKITEIQYDILIGELSDVSIEEARRLRIISQ